MICTVTASPLLPSDRPLADSGREGVLILLADELDGERVRIEIEGIRGGDLAAAGGREVTARRGELVPARIDLKALPEPDDDDDSSGSGDGSGDDGDSSGPGG